MKSHLHRLEKQIEKLVEDSLSRLLGVEIQPASIASQLARAMDDGVRYSESDQPFAPDQFALTFNPQDVDALLKHAPGLHDDLASGLLEVARTNDYRLSREPQVTLAADPTLSRREVRVVAWHSSSPVEFTQAITQEENSERGGIPSGAYLVVGGSRHYPLDQPVINIGRRLDNHLILDDPHVSRTHAQIRARDSRYVLFDLGSTSGTRVNNRSINQHILQPGDVIRIADINLVYGEDPSGPPEETSSYIPPFPPRPAGDQPTRTSNWHRDTDQ
ncbi:MAG: DUF3662 domain-containing protein [Anaerolineales bacterium]|nr:DUF3662 domain-containing protein [Anaerolineales bacterium]